MFNELKDSFMKGFRGTLKYGYFAPLTAVWLAIKRPRNYVWHLKALYRLAFWRGRMYP